MKNCKVDLKVVYDFVKTKVSKDQSFKDFDVLAKYIMQLTNQPDDIKAVVLKAIAQIYTAASVKDPSFKIDSKADVLLTTKVQDADLHKLYESAKSKYFPKASSTPTSLEELNNQVDDTKIANDFELVNQVKNLVANFNNIIKRLTASQAYVIKNQSLLFIKKMEDMIQNSPVASRTKTVALQFLSKVKDQVDKIGQYVPISKTKFGTIYEVIENDTVVDQVFLNQQDGNYYRLSDPTQKIEISGKQTRAVFYDRPGRVGREITQDGGFRILTIGESASGTTLNFGVGDNKVKEILLNSEDPNAVMQITYSKKQQKANRERTEKIKEEIPNRSLITYESIEQQRFMSKNNKPVAAVSSAVSGGTMMITLPGTNDKVFIYDTSNYAAVYPDNTTVPLDFTNRDQWDLIKSLFKRTDFDGNIVELTDQDLEKIAAMQTKINEFKQKAEEYLKKEGKQEAVIPKEFYQGLFNLQKGSPRRQKISGESEGILLSDAVNKKEAQDMMVPVTVVKVDYDGELVDDSSEEKQIPMIIRKVKREWTFAEGVLANDERILTEDGELMTADQYFTKMHPNALKVHYYVSNFPQHIGYAMVQVDPKTKQYQFIGMNRDFGADPVKNLLSFASALSTLRNAIKADPTSNNKLTREFNQKKYTFSPYGGWYADIAAYYDEKNKEVKFSIEVRPSDDKNFETASGGNEDKQKTLKKASRVYIDGKALNNITGLLSKMVTGTPFNDFVAKNGNGIFKSYKDFVNSDGSWSPLLFKFLTDFMSGSEAEKELQKAYDELVGSIKDNFTKSIDKFQEAGLSKVPAIQLLMENENSALSGRNFLKVNDKITDLNQNTFDQFRLMTGNEVVQFNSIYMTGANDTAAPVKSVSLTQVTPDVSTKPVETNTVLTDDDVEIDEDEDALSLVENNESVVSYDDQTWKSEMDWLQRNLPSSIQVSDLKNILDMIKADGRILGYFKDKVVYLNKELSSRGTAYHEAFHGVFRHLMTSTERSFFVEKALKEMGSISKEAIQEFRSKRGLFHLSEQGIKSRMAEEYMADKFKDYVLEKKEPTAAWLRYIVRLLQKVMNFFTGKSNKIDDITQLFDRINTGYYKNANVVSEFKEGAFELLPARRVIVGVKENGKLEAKQDYFSNYDQIQLVNRLAFETSMANGASFDEKYRAAVEKLMAEYDVEKLVAANPGADAQKVRNKYSDLFANYRFVLGDKNSMYQNITGDSTLDRKINEQTINEASSALKEQVRKVVKDVNVKNILMDQNAELNADDVMDDEDRQIASYDDSFGNLNPMDGLSRQFRKLFALLPYTYDDKDTGVKMTKMIDGTKVFYTFMKISADVPADMILQNLESSIDTVKEDGNEDAYQKLSTVYNTLKMLFGLDENYKPTRNVNMYNQFMNTFFITELPTLIYQVRTFDKTYTAPDGSKLVEAATAFNIHDATIQRDVFQEIEKLKRSYTLNYFDKSAAERREIHEKVKAVIAQELPPTGDLKTNDKTILIRRASNIKAALDLMGLNFSQSLIEFSLVNIDKERNPDKTFTGKSKAAQLLNANPLLSSQGSYLQEDFFKWVAGSQLGPNVNIFEKTEFDLLDPEDLEEMDKIKVERTPSQTTQIDGINAILKRAAKYMIKYNVDANVSVFQNAENKNVYRYVKYTPLLLMAQTIKTKGLQGLAEEYPMFTEWFESNPYFNAGNKDKNIKLFMDNFEVSMFGGTRQTIGNLEQDGATFKHTDPRSKHIADIAMFTQRDILRKNSTEVVTFKRSFSILEGSSTNFLIPVMYKRMFGKDGFVTDKKDTPEIINLILTQIGQEYNRIGREWSSREERAQGSSANYLDYNAKKNSDGTLDTTSNALRAYNFSRLAKFFGKNESGVTTYVDSDADVAQKRRGLGDRLIEMAKQGVSFKDILAGKVPSVDIEELKSELLNYVNQEYENFTDSLKNYGVISVDENKNISSEFLPTTVKVGLYKASLAELEYDEVNVLLKDYFLNDFASRLFVNQFFDADIAVNVKNATNYAMRNKFGIIAGDSMREGFHTVAYVEKLKIWVDEKNIESGQYDRYEDIPQHLITEDSNWKQVDVFDGQSITTLEHRIDMYGKQGRLEELVNDGTSEKNYDVKSILQKARVEPLTNEEIKYLEDAKIVLGSYKTATGGLTQFHKQSEHILLRTDVSYIKPGKDQTKQEVIDYLKSLYAEADAARKMINEGQEHVMMEAYGKTPRAVLKEVYENIHAMYEPLPGREALHFTLNSMELAGIDQLMDLNSSKRGTKVPAKLSATEVTDFGFSLDVVPNKYKYMQVETSGVSRTVTTPTQKRQLIDTDVLLSDPNVPANLKDAIRNYRTTLEQSAKLSLDEIKTIMDSADGEVNIAPILKTMRKGLESQGADANTLKLFEIDETTGKPKHNVNLPIFKTLFQNYFFAFYSNNLFSESSAGRKDYIVTSYGYKLVVDENDKVIPQDVVKANPEKYKNYATRYPGIRKEIAADGSFRYVVEVIIPKGMFKSKQHEELYLNRMTEMISTRIPTEDKRSMVVARAVDYVDATYQNIIIVPQAVHLLSGSDLDIDSLYSQTLAEYEGIDGNMHIYGEYGTYKDFTENSAKFLEYLMSKSKDQNLEGEITDEYDRILQDEDVMEELPGAVQALLDYMKVSDFGMTPDNAKQRLAELKAIRNSYYQNYKSLKSERQKIYAEYVELRKENERLFEEVRQHVIQGMKEAGEEVNEASPEFQEEVNILASQRIQAARLSGQTEGLPDFKKQGNYSAALRGYQSSAQTAFRQLTGQNTDIQKAVDSMKKLDQMFRLIATLNVLAKFKMPTTVQEVVASKTPLVKEIIQNNNVKHQIDILSNPYVFENLYKNERSDTSFFGKLIESQERPIDAVVDKYDMNSPAWVVNLLTMNSASDDNIGVAAMMNKFAAFASKFGLNITEPIWNVNGKTFSSFNSTAVDQDGKIFRVLAEIGKSIGMSADAKKEPYPSILNLDQETMGISLSMIAQGVDPTMAFNINMIPIIAELIKEKQLSTSNTVTIEESWKNSSFKSIAEKMLITRSAVFVKDKERAPEVFQMKDGKFVVDRSGQKMFRDIQLSFKYDYSESRTRESLSDYGFSAVYKGTDTPVADDVLELFLLDRYTKQIAMQRDVFAVNSILGLVKKIKPDFQTLDKIVYDYAYLMGFLNKKPNFTNIREIIANKAKEYTPLIDGIRHMFETAEKIFLERNPVFMVLNEELGDTMITYNMSANNKNAINTHVVRYMLINRIRSRFESELAEEQAKDKPNQAKIQLLKSRLTMFTSDFWEGKTSAEVAPMEEELLYLLKTHPGNPFVQFLRQKSIKGITYIEGLSRMKLDGELTDAIIDGYNLLSRSLDDRSKLIADKLLVYLLVKDNLDFSNNTFLKYINPDKLQSVSDDLTTLQTQLNQSVSSAAKRKDIVSGKIFREYLTNPKLDLSSLSATIVNKALTYIVNKEKLVRSKRFSFGGRSSSRIGRIKDINSTIQFLSKVFPNLTTHDWRDIYEVEKTDKNEGYFDLYVPSSSEVDKGTVEINLDGVEPDEGEIQGAVLGTAKINAEYETDNNGNEKFVGWKFPMSVINAQGQLLVLQTIDGIPVGEKIAAKISERLNRGSKFKNPAKISLGGFVAKYKVSAFEGVGGSGTSISNNGFTNQDARALYDYTEKSEKYSFITSTPEFNEFLMKMYADYNIPTEPLERLKNWVKTDVYRTGEIRFGKDGVYELSYQTIGDSGFREKYIIRLSPVAGKPLAVKAAQFKIIDGAKIELYSKEFVAVETQKLTKEERKAIRREQLAQKGDEKMAALFNMTVEEAMEKGVIKNNRGLNETKQNEVFQKYVDKINNMKSTEEGQLIYADILNTQSELHSLPGDLFNEIGTLLNDKLMNLTSTPSAGGEVKVSISQQKLVNNVKPTIDLSKEWKGDLESRPVYTPEGVNTMRTTVAKPNEHFGNPFSEAGYGDTIKVGSIAEAVTAYKDWLLGTNHRDVKPQQREWILDQINQGKLDGATLLYAGKSEARGQGMHPTALVEVVEQLRGKKVNEINSNFKQKVIPVVFLHGRSAANGYEVSSAATTDLGKKFSALNAKLSDGRTIEEAYQLDVKGLRGELAKWLTAGNRYYDYRGTKYDMNDSKNHWIFGKGKAPATTMTQQESYQAYKNLWMQFAKENPTLIRQLMKEANGKVLTDRFANTPVSQARALADILNEALVDPSIIEFKKGPIQDALDDIDSCNPFK